MPSREDIRLILTGRQRRAWVDRPLAALDRDPATRQSAEAASLEAGIIIGNYSGYATNAIFEIWRSGNIADTVRPAERLVL